MFYVNMFLKEGRYHRDQLIGSVRFYKLSTAKKFAKRLMVDNNTISVFIHNGIP